MKIFEDHPKWTDIAVRFGQERRESSTCVILNTKTPPCPLAPLERLLTEQICTRRGLYFDERLRVSRDSHISHDHFAAAEREMSEKSAKTKASPVLAERMPQHEDLPAALLQRVRGPVLQTSQGQDGQDHFRLQGRPVQRDVDDVLAWHDAHQEVRVQSAVSPQPRDFFARLRIRHRQRHLATSVSERCLTIGGAAFGQIASLGIGLSGKLAPLWIEHEVGGLKNAGILLLRFRKNSMRHKCVNPAA